MQALFFFGKPLLYLGLYFAAGRLWRDAVTPRWWRAPAATLVRYAAGWVVLLPLGAWLFNGADAPQTALGYLVFYALRFALWGGAAKLCYRGASWKRVAALAVAGTALNAAVDAAVFDDGLGRAFNFRMCAAPSTAPVGAA
jgi:hypothetical protein